MPSTQELLTELDRLYSELAIEEATKTAVLDDLIPLEVKLLIQGAELEYAARTVELIRRVTDTELALKDAVLTDKRSVKGERIQAVYNPPRVSWDNKKLEGYGAAHPEIMAFRSVGEAYVTLRKVK